MTIIVYKKDGGQQTFEVEKVSIMFGEIKIWAKDGSEFSLSAANHIVSVFSN